MRPFRLSPAERAAWQAKAAEVERQRTRQVARMANNLNQLARWANKHASAADAVTVIANLVSFKRSLLDVARLRGDRDRDAH